MSGRPKVSWLAVRYIDSCIDEGRPTLEEIIEQAYEFGLGYVEIYLGMLRSHDADYLRHISAVLRRNQVRVSQITCAPDFTHPEAAERERQYEQMVRNIVAAQALGARGVRVTAGCVHEETSREDGIRWAAECLARLGDFASYRAIKLGFENHYRDRRWTRNDFALHTPEYLAIFERLRDTPVGVNFDTSNQLMSGDDPMAVLEVVKEKVWHMHASDRLPGEYRHTVVGEGGVDYGPIFRCLAEVGYKGFISLEDGNPEGDEGTMRGLRFIRHKIVEYWG
jgi:sugar phosphate isomerase/epimerase